MALMLAAHFLPNVPPLAGRRKRITCSRVLPLMIFQTCCIASAMAQSPNVVGKWNVEITFANSNQYSLRFDGQPDGKGSLQLLDPRSAHWEGAKSAEAKWTRGDGNSVTFSGPVEFPLGNIGRDAGTLALKGTFETKDLITGEVEFSSPGGDKSSKHGTFKAVREN
jgi:hypothetical protein